MTAASKTCADILQLYFMHHCVILLDVCKMRSGRSLDKVNDPENYSTRNDVAMEVRENLTHNVILE